MKHAEHESRRNLVRRALTSAAYFAELHMWPQAVFWTARALLELTYFTEEERVIDLIKERTKP